MIRDNLKFILLSLSLIASSVIVSDALIAVSQSLHTELRAIAIRDSSSAMLSDQTLDAIADRVRQKLMAEVPQKPSRPQRPAPGERSIDGVSMGNFILGEATAPVAIVEFSDFECPFSKKFHSAAFADIKKNFIDTGKAKFSFRHLPLSFHPNARAAAVAIECAGDQNQYWPMYERLMTKSEYDAQSFQRFAAEIGLDTAAFNTCVSGDSKHAGIAADMQFAGENEISSTPTIIINGRVIEGAYPYEQFESIISRELEKAK